jgi:hypothetical protein
MIPVVTNGRYPEDLFDDMMQEIAEASVAAILTDEDDDTSFGSSLDRVHTPQTAVGGYTHTTMASLPHPWFMSDIDELSGRQQFATESERFTSPAYTTEFHTSDEDEDLVDLEGNGSTTIMLRNIPNKYTRAGLLSALIERGFDPARDCNNLYLPMDVGSGCNLGYSFLNFTTHSKAVAFMRAFDGCRLPSAGSRKVCTVVWANKQGLFQHCNPPVRTLAGMDTCKIFVGGLPASTTEADLVEYFSKFGSVRECSIVSNRQTGASRGFGFCEFVHPDSVQRVHYAQLRRPHSINCRVVSVRPYNVTQYAPKLQSFD